MSDPKPEAGDISVALALSASESGVGVSSNSRDGHGHKPGLSYSPLAKPETLIHELAARIQEYWYFPDPDPLYVLLGALAANMVKGDPVWLIVVGPPSSLKTVLIRGLMNVPKVIDASEITSVGALLSGVRAGEVERGATGGLLRKVGQRGAILLEDYTSSLVKGVSANVRTEILNALRLVYNGRWTRDVGAGGGKSLVWIGKIGVIGGATPEIDRLNNESAALGERWVYYRLPSTDGYGESRKAGQNRDPDESREDIRGWVASFFVGMGLEFPCPADCKRTMEADKSEHVHVVEERLRDLDDWELNRLVAMASFVARTRSDVPRDNRTYEVIGVTEPEAPPRLTTILAQLYLGLERVGLPVGERWRIVGKVALDSCPRVKMQSAILMMGEKKTWKLSELKSWLKCGSGTVRRAVEDLAILGVVEYKPGKIGRVARNGSDGEVDQEAEDGGARLTDWAKKQISLGWGNIKVNAAGYQI